MRRPIGIDLFAGAGGLSIGFEQAGFDIAVAVEIDPIHAATHKYNFPECVVLPVSVSVLTGEAIRKAGKITGPVDVVFGGAPCQGFSLIGQRALDDPRNGLVRDFVRLVKELDATYFVFENVKGITLGRHREFLEELIAEFQELGYQVRKPWRVLNAYNFGVPQDRERLILFGAKAGHSLPTYPLAKTRAHGSDLAFLDLPFGPSVRDAIGDLPDAELYDDLQRSDSVSGVSWGEPSAYARMLRCLDNDAWHFGYPRLWDPSVLTSSTRTEHTDISRQRFLETQPGSVEPISRFFKLPSNGVSNTLRAGTDSARGAFTSPRPIHYLYPRCITVREMARLHGFPDWFRFHETKWHGARQIGNSVPPPLAHAVADVVIAALGKQPTQPNRVMALGDPKLLQMGMAEAAEYWGVPRIIGGRDRKSGAKKRSQSETEAARLSAQS